MSTRYRSLLAFTFLVAAAALQGGTGTHGQSGPACAPGLNAIACENLRPGDAPSDWEVAGAGDPSIQGYATAMSVNRGETVRFKIKTDAASYRVDIYRLGYYGGMGARKVATVTPSATLPQSQPTCTTVIATGLIDCGNWAESASWAVPSTATSGIYVARPVRVDTGGASHIVFIVRDDAGASELLFQTSDTTWQAYNSYGGNSLYRGSPAGRAYKVSYNRPFDNRANAGGPMESWLFSSEYPMLRWLEANGFDVSYTTGIDTDRNAAALLNHKVFLSVGHDEYWSARQRTNVEAARGAGIHLAFFSGNEVFWKTRWENDSAGATHRTLVCYKETIANAKIDPDPAWTGTWRDTRFSPPSDGARPENGLTGTLFMVNGVRNDAITVPALEGKRRFWRNTPIASLAAGQIAALPTGTLGYEWDEDKDNGFRPAGLIHLSSTTLDVTPQYLLNEGSSYGGGVATHHMTLYRHASGSLVFGAGTVQWPWGLDATHDRPGPAVDVRMQQATVNLFADMGVQPTSLQAGLVSATASADAVGPESTITAPAHGSSVQSGTQVTISGTAADLGGGVLSAVEVSTDSGATWHPASGLATWTYAWTPFTPGSSVGSATLMSRAVDDSANIQATPASVTVAVQPGPGLVAAYGFEEASGGVARDQTQNANDGTLSGASWAAAGRFGGALSFDGIDDVVTIADAATLDLTTAMTLEAWVYPTALSGWRTALLKETTNGLVYSLYAHDNVPRPAAYVRTGTTETSAVGSVAIPLNAWTHLAATFDASTLRLFVNGVQAGTWPIGGAITTSSGPVRIGGNAIWGEHFQGLIDEVRIYGRVLQPSEIQVDMATPVGGSPVPDTTPPSVSMTAPAAGTTVNGTITLSADASDNVGVAGVQFLVDGNPVGAEDTTAPYSAAWDTRAVPDGSHSIAARARDAAGQMTTSAAVTVTIANAPDTTFPTVSIDSPAADATVSGSVTVTASAADNVSVAGVQFLLDGAALGSEDTSAPYAVTWTTTSATNGSHTLTARARDVAGNQTTSGPVSVTVSNTATPAGLIAAYAFNEGSGTTAADLSGNGRTATLSGAAWTTAGRFDGALSFDGVNDWLTIADAAALDLTTGMTLEAWVRPLTLSGWRTVIMKETGTGLAYTLYAHDNAPYPAGTINVGGTDQSTPGTAALPLGTWTHLATTYDGSSLRLYVNGAQVGTRAITGSMATSTSPLRIGGNAPWGEYFHGLIDEVRLFNRARTAAEIQADMNAPVDPGPADTEPPTAPSGLTASGALGTATLGWSASTDNRGVANYNVHRSTTTGFTPSVSNRIAQPTTPGYTDTGLAAGTYYYVVTAQDAAGNVSGRSNEASAAVTADTTPPSVSITAPVPDATVSGSVNVTATASDSVGVAGVQFLLDGAALGVEDTTAPYATSWDTARSTAGSHVLTARARDAAGNATTSAPVSVTVASSPPPTSPPLGLVAAYAFEEGAGTTVADASGTGNSGTITGASWTTAGRFGKALSFNGSTNWVTINDAPSLDLTSGMTLEAWVKPAALSSWRQVILKEIPNGLAYSLYAHNNAPQPAATINVGGSDQSAVGTSALPLDTWTHLAATYDGSTLRLFVNGAQAQAVSVSGTLITSNAPLRIAGNAVWGEHFSGVIDEVRVYNRALSASEIQSDMNAAVGAPPAGDVTPPSVSVTAPAAGATVGGTVTIKADASDAGGIAWVEFRVEGATVGSVDSDAPYEALWNTGGVPNGSTQTITAIARDAAGNLATSAPVTVTVTNQTDPASVGAWTSPFDIGVVGVNMVQLHTGKILMYPGNRTGSSGAAVFDPATGTKTPVPLTGSNIFCSGHAILADGRVLVVGGWDEANGILGSAHAHIFDPVTEQWTRLPDMAYRRWYPTATTLADGRVLVTSGATTCETCIADVPEIYDPVTSTWTQLTAARLPIPYYPLAFLLPDGKVLVTGSTDTASRARTLDVATQTWTVVDPNIFDGSSAAMYLPGKVLQSGTSSDPAFPIKPAVATTAVLDMTQASPAWRQTAPMAYPRAYNNLTILPDGSVLAIGGGTDTGGRDLSKSVFAAERWSPVTETWSTMASASVGRLYHSTTLLLPDARVLVAGGGDVAGAVDQNAAEYYSPPYLFKGARPTITAAPSVLEHGSSFFVSTPDASAIGSVALMRLGAATHAFDENQRFIPLTFEQAPGGLTMQAPATAGIAPPGHYMLFILNSAGVPSIAKIVRFAAPYEDAEPPSAPTGLSATAGVGSVALAWSASSDNTGVTGYDVHRSTVSGFVPGPATRIAQRSTTTYTDSALAAGTYHYVVIAKDAAGNASPPSNQASATVTSDGVAPSVAVTSPTAGSTVSGAVTVTASASDDVGVLGVQFLLDGAPLGAEDTTAPYSVSWDTRTAANGAHTLSARARDGGFNQTVSAAVGVTVSNTVPPPATGLIAAYAFEEGTGTTTADATGKAHTGTISGAAWSTAGKNGKALAFDGVNDWVTIADAADLDLTTGMTLEAWVKPSSLSGWSTVVMKEGSTTALAYSLYANDGNPWPALTARFGSVDRSAVGTARLTLGVWTHLAATYDGAVMRLYVNGVQVGTRAQTGNMNVSAHALRIGGNAVWGDEYFAGLIDDVRIYNRALTASEIQTDMNTAVR